MLRKEETRKFFFDSFLQNTLQQMIKKQQEKQ